MVRLKWWKGEDVPVHALMSYRGRRGVATLIIYLGNRYMGAVNNTTNISNDVYRGWKYNYMFRPNPAIIMFTSKGYQRFVTTMRLCEISPSSHNHIVVTNL